MMESLAPEYQQGNYIRERTPARSRRTLRRPTVYPTKDGLMLVIGANQDGVFKRLCDAMGRPELAQDPRYKTHTARGKNQQELDDLIADWTRTVDAETLEGLMETNGIRHGRIYRAPEMPPIRTSRHGSRS